MRLFRKKRYRYIVYGLIVLITILLIKSGINNFHDDYYINLLASIPTTLLGIIISVEIIQGIIDYKSNAAWDTVRKQLIYQLFNNLLQCTSFYAYFLNRSSKYNFLFHSSASLPDNFPQQISAFSMDFFSNNTMEKNQDNINCLFENVSRKMDSITQIYQYYLAIPGYENETTLHFNDLFSSFEEWKQLNLINEFNRMSSTEFIQSAINTLNSIINLESYIFIEHIKS